jgi:hypothetical protein
MDPLLNKTVCPIMPAVRREEHPPPTPTRSQIHERTISLGFLGMILRVLRLELSVYNVYISNQFQPTFAQGVGGVKSIVEVTVRKTL